MVMFWRLGHLVCGVEDAGTTGSEVDAVGVVGVARQDEVWRRARQPKVVGCMNTKDSDFNYKMFLINEASSCSDQPGIST